jgi:hypothetical protein
MSSASSYLKPALIEPIDPNSPLAHRPKFDAAWWAFYQVNLSVEAVGRTIGGEVGEFIKDGTFKNACPIRMSYVLNKTGFPITKMGYKVYRGADHCLYMIRMLEMFDYLVHTFGEPDKTVKHPQLSDFAEMKGILAVKGSGWNNAKGHITLWEGSSCTDTCHLTGDPENNSFIPENASIWVLPPTILAPIAAPPVPED